MKRVSIIIPVYRVERYIRPCLESVFHQGLADDDFEVIIVNDGTPDNSMQVIADMVRQHANVTVVDQTNQGLSMARNNGMARATGEYILLLDSDDLLFDGSLPRLLDRATGSQADLVVAGFVKKDDDEILQMLAHPLPLPDCNVSEKTGQRLLVEDLNPRQCYVWRTLYRRAFLEQQAITFVPGIVFEDIPFTTECYLKAGKCLLTTYPFYIYRVGHTSISSRQDKRKGKHFATAMAKTWHLRNSTSLAPDVQYQLDEHIFAHLCVLLYATSHEITPAADRWAVIAHLQQEAPDLRFSHNLHQRIISAIYRWRMLSPYIELRVLLARCTLKKHTH